MAKHGIVGPFSSDSKDWSAYVERFDQYFIANDITSGQKKRGILPQRLLDTDKQTDTKLGVTTKPSDLVYDELTKKVLDYQKLRRSVTVEQFKFNNQLQNLSPS